MKARAPTALAFLFLCCLPAGAGELRYKITDAAGAPIPAKLNFQTPDGKSRAKAKIPSKDPHIAGREGVAYTLPGDGAIEVPDGKYRVHVSHGFEWSVAVVEVEVAAGRPALVEARLERVVDTRGWLSADMHLHTLTFSGHGDTNVEERIITLCAEEVEWAVATDHNHLTDYAPYVKKLGAERWIKTTVGNEVTTTLIGHFNAFPFDPARPPTDWTITDPREIFRRLRLEGAEVIQVNHPRWVGSRGAYFRDLDLSPHTGDSRNPLFSRLFDSFEVANGGDLSGWVLAPDFGTTSPPGLDYSVRDDWYNLLNMGLRFTAVGNSDSHHVDEVIGGCPRNFIQSSVDDPARADPAELMRAVKAGALTVGAGIFLAASVDGRPPGSTVRLAPAEDRREVAIAIRIEAPPWVSADRVVVVKDGEEVATIPIAGPPPAKGAVRHEGVWRDRPARDAWYVVYAIGDEAPVPMQHSKTFPLAFSNPFWVDADGDGRFAPLRDHARRAVERVLQGADAAQVLAFEPPSFRRQALGALRELAGTGADPDLMVAVLACLARDPDGAVRAGAAEQLAERRERSALLALLEARARADDSGEGAALDFQLARAGHMPAVASLRDAYRREGGMRRHAVRRDLLELARKTRFGPWRVAGPYPAREWQEGMEAAHPPELEAAGCAPARWRLSSVDKKSYLNFRDTMDPRAHAIAYGRLRARAPQDVRAWLLVESENPLRVWVNGREVLRQGPRKKAEAGLEIVPADLRAGENEVLVKCAVETGGWGLSFHAVEPPCGLLWGE